MDHDSIDRPSPATSAPNDGGVDRRALLAGVGSAVVAGLGAPAQGAAAATAAPASHRRIDAHTHFSSLKVLDALEKEEGKLFLAGRTRSMRTLNDVQAR